MADFLGAIAEAYGSALLRAKGIVRIRGEDRPLAVHGVQHIFHPPTRLAAWPPGLRNSTLVLILDGVDTEQVIDAARDFGLLPVNYNQKRERYHAV